MARIVCDGRFNGVLRKAVFVRDLISDVLLTTAPCAESSRFEAEFTADLPDQWPMSDTAHNPNDIDLHQLPCAKGGSRQDLPRRGFQKWGWISNR